MARRFRRRLPPGASPAFPFMPSGTIEEVYRPKKKTVAEDVVEEVAVAISRVAQAVMATSTGMITIPDEPDLLIEGFVSSGLATLGTYTIDVGGVSIPVNPTLVAPDGDPEIHHFYAAGAAVQALAGTTQTVTVGGSLLSNANVAVRVLSNVDAVAPIAEQKIYGVSESSTSVLLSTVGVVNNFVSMYVAHSLSRTWDTFTGVSNASVNGRAAIGELAVTADGSVDLSIGHSAGNANARKDAILIQYKAA